MQSHGGAFAQRSPGPDPQHHKKMKADNPRKCRLGKEDWEGRKPKSVFKPVYRVNNRSVSTLGPLGECAEKKHASEMSIQWAGIHQLLPNERGIVSCSFSCTQNEHRTWEENNPWEES